MDTKICEPFVITLLNCCNEVGLCAHNTYSIMRFNSEHNCEGMCTNQLTKVTIMMSCYHDVTIYDPN